MFVIGKGTIAVYFRLVLRMWSKNRQLQRITMDVLARIALAHSPQRL